MTTPAYQLYAGSLEDFSESMAEEIEIAYNEMRIAADLPALPTTDTRDRRMLFISIARGVITHLQKHQQAIIIAVPGVSGSVTPTIGVK